MCLRIFEKSRGPHKYLSSFVEDTKSLSRGSNELQRCSLFIPSWKKGIDVVATRRHLETDETVAPPPMIRLPVQVQLTFSKKNSQCAQMEPYLSHGQRQRVNTTDNGKICHCRCFTEASSTLEDVPRLPLQASKLHPLQPTVPP